ncbi:MAG: Ig-like domain-containing protein [Flavobacteriaceae bacterium]|nr:Ig-like domain-containing protein [Flavobacteriaceae bacterium]
MPVLKRSLSVLFLALVLLASWQCARRGNPSGGPKDETPPVLLRSEPENLTVNFRGNQIKLYFDEYIKLQDAQNQLIVSPPLKYTPEIKPLGGASKFIEINLKDTLQENTTYTINFGQSIVDNNEGNPTSFLTYVFSTGDYLDSLSISGAVKDAFNRKADEFVSVMLYELDTAYTDSSIYKRPPNYITNTLDSLPLFELKNLKAGRYALFAIKDEGKNNLFDQRSDKIAFGDTITVPSDSLFLMNLFKEEPDYSASVPSYVAKNKIIFGYQGRGTVNIEPLTVLPDSVRTRITKEREKDSLNYWLTPTDIDSIIFVVTNSQVDTKDTFTVKTRKLGLDTLMLSPSHSRSINFNERFEILANTPITGLDTSKINVIDKDSLAVTFTASKDSIENKIAFDFELTEDQKYTVRALPGAISDFFGTENDTVFYTVSTGKYSEYGNLEVNISGVDAYPIIVQLTTDKGELVRELLADAPKGFTFNNLSPGNYGIRVIFDTNGNGKWDTGNYLQKKQPERISYYPDFVNIRANWEQVETFIIAPN